MFGGRYAEAVHSRSVEDELAVIIAREIPPGLAIFRNEGVGIYESSDTVTMCSRLPLPD